MRELPCPYCARPIAFSWADFVFLSNLGKSDIFCLGCKKLCTIDDATTIIAFGAGILPVVAIYILVFGSGMLAPPQYVEAIYVLCAIPVVLLLRAFATEKFAELEEKPAK